MIYDISQPLFESVVFPGDRAPERIVVKSMDRGDRCNLTELAMCAHNGTHVDAPCHFVKGAKGMDEVHLEKFIGPAFVADFEGEVSAEDARKILAKAEKALPAAAKRILLKGKTTVTLEAARVFAEVPIDLIGNESQTVGPETDAKDVHVTLLSKEVVLLEGIRLGAVKEGVYLLNCAPINLTHCDGAPCRAVLMDL